MSKIEYKDLLYQISEKLDESELPRLIFMCSEEIPETSVENIRNVLALFKELEKHNRLGIDLLDILKEILKQMKKRSLLKKVEEFETRRKAQSVGIVTSLKRLATCIKGAVKLVCNFRTIAGGLLVVGSGMALRSCSSLDEFVEVFNKVVLVSISKLVEISEGSLCFTVQAETSSALKELWDMYKSGTLQNRLQEFLVTDEIKQLASGEDVEVTVYIDEQEYKAAYLDLMLVQKESDVTEEDRLGGRRHRNSDSFLYFKRNEDDVTLLKLNLERQRRQFLEEEIKKLRAEIAMAERVQTRLVCQEQESTQGTEDLERLRSRSRRHSDSSLYCKAKDEATAQSEGGTETKHLDSEKYDLVQRYLQNIQETHSITTETTDSGIRTHGEPSDLEMQDISAMSSGSKHGKYDPRRRRNDGEPSWYDKAVNTKYQEEVIPIPEGMTGLIIGRKGWRKEDIMEKAGVKEINIRDGEVHIRGTEEQCSKAKKNIIDMILEAEREMKSSKKRYPGHFVEIPREFKRHVAGKGGDNLRNISTLTGAQVLPRGNKLELRGLEKEIKQAELLLKRRVASARIKTDTICCYIDDKNLPEGCDLKLVPLEELERMVLPGSRSQYRLRPSEEYEPEAGTRSDIPCYQADLMDRALECLRKIKQEIESKKFQEADMWCHFGIAIIREPDEAEVAEMWNIAQAVAKIQKGRKSDWRIAFKEGVQIDKEVLRETFSTQPAEDDLYAARYDFSFLTPQSTSVRCKVWVAKEGVQGKLEELPIPFSDVRNIIEEIHLDDELTRSRCRAWLVLSSTRYLQADIICPGCVVDFRIMIRPISTYATYEQEQTKALAGYLTKLKFTEPNGILLPDETLPKGFLLDYKRCSHRTMYVPRDGFTLIVSEEATWSSDDRGEQNRESTDLHLGCEEWDRALSGEDWEPEMIVSKLPEFLQFVHQVQDFLSLNHCSV